jgi:hypothetical protein
MHSLFEESIYRYLINVCITEIDWDIFKCANCFLRCDTAFQQKSQILSEIWFHQANVLDVVSPLSLRLYAELRLRLRYYFFAGCFLTKSW